MVGLSVLRLRAIAWALTLAVALLLAGVGTMSASAPADCQFVLGFRTLHELDPYDVGSCTSNQSHAGNGDATQMTSRGMLVWRKADNFTAFTDGYRTWVNGPHGLQERLNTERFPWEAADGHAPAPASSNVAAALSGPTLDSMASQFFSLLNTDRKLNGLPPLALNGQLSSLAQSRAQGLLTSGGPLSHYDSAGHLVLKDIMNDNNIAYATAGENLAENNYDVGQTVTVANTGLMNSPTHRANILNPNYQQVGIGLAGPNARGQFFFVQLFLQPV
jgi:uncharacterized protein YkwD